MKNAAVTAFFVMVLVTGTTAQNAKSEKRLPRDTRTSCQAFVQGFYDWYVPLALQERAVRTWDFAVKRKPNVFSPQLRRAIKQDSDAQQKASKTTGELVGLDFDPFLNSQDPSKRFAVESVTAKGTGCRVTVYGVSEGEREKVTPEVKLEHGHWQFINLQYEFDGHPDDLLSILKLLRSDDGH